MNVPNPATLSESASKEVLARHGIPFGVEGVVHEPRAAASWAHSHRPPFVVKANGPLLSHKSERGLVRLGLANPGDVEGAATEILGRIRLDDGEVSLTVAEMTVGERELIVGAFRDPSLGPCLLIGAGGIFAEQIADTSIRRMPVSDSDVEAMVASLRSFAVFHGARHCAPLDIVALHGIATGLEGVMQDRSLRCSDRPQDFLPHECSPHSLERSRPF